MRLGLLSYTEAMTINTTDWTDDPFVTTHWPLHSDQDDANNLWDYASDTWDNAADTWDAFFDSGTDSNPISTDWGDDTAPATTAWTLDM